MNEINPFNLVSHLYRQREFSLRTFGPGRRVGGVTDHIFFATTGRDAVRFFNEFARSAGKARRRNSWAAHRAGVLRNGSLETGPAA